jgi:hypothetical protein
MFVAIVGSRDFGQLNRVAGFVRSLAAKYPDAVVVSGGARGVDRVAEAEARRCGLSVVSYRPFQDGREFAINRVTEVNGESVTERVSGAFFGSYGRAAFARNAEIVMAADQVVAFHDGVSKGTAHSIELAKRAGKPVHVYRDSEFDGVSG